MFESLKFKFPRKIENSVFSKFARLICKRDDIDTLLSHVASYIFKDVITTFFQRTSYCKEQQSSKVSNERFPYCDLLGPFLKALPKVSMFPALFHQQN